MVEDRSHDMFSFELSTYIPNFSSLNDYHIGMGRITPLEINLAHLSFYRT